MAEAETSQPSTSTSTLPVPSSTSSNTSCVPQKTNDSDLPCLSSDFEISKLQNSPKKKKNRKHKSPLSKKFRKIKQSTTVTETMAVKKTFPSRGRNPFTSIEATTLPTSRSVTSENTVDHLYYKPTKPKHPKTWKRRKSPVSDISSKDNSLTSVASMTSPSSLSNVIPTRRQNFGFNEIDTDYEKNESDATTTETTRTPKMFEVNETLESETTTLTTSTIQTESSNASTPIITESDEITERTQSPAKNGIQSPTSVSVEMNPSSPLPLKFVQKERTKIECQPRVAAEVVQVLAKHRETDDWRLPNEKFELINEEGESLKKLANSSTTTSTISTKSPLSPTLSTPPSSAQVDKIAQRFSPQFTPRSSKTLADSNDPFLSNNPYW
uniref:Uncharacterized protein n=1 Tax=Panagrolaimus sp. ES5 TaxID=591445 RepID=A0AC34G8I4_9BILA